MTSRPLVDLTNCDVEPIHIPGSVQPHGVMLVVAPQGGVITYVSENAGALFGRSVPGLIGVTVEDLLGDKIAHDLANAAAKSGGSEIAAVLLGVTLSGQNGAFDLTTHRHKGRVFIEIEPSTDGGQSAQTALELTQSLIRRVGLESDVDGIAAMGARLVRAMLGYDRVMVYRFLHNGAGRVIAEAKVSHLPSFLGQHFPASDIPFQARRLYLLNAIRMIGDAGYEPVPLTPGLAPGQEPIDMSFAQLRSVSPIHCEYLRNMGVAASMSISIIVDGELWGLISCHHDTPKVVPIPLRVGAELFGQYFSLQIAMAERRAEMLAATEARERLDRIVATLTPEAPVNQILPKRLDDLAQLMPSNGAGLWIEGSWTTCGLTPPDEDVARLRALMIEAAPGRIWQTPELRAHLPEAAGYETQVSGVLGIPISSVPRDYLVLFRSEEAHDVEWAGEPVKRVVSTPMGDRLSPRGSFETWREDVRGRSNPWTDADLAVAEAIRTYLRDIVLRYNEVTADERTRAEQRRRVLNDELNHRVKNIISLVKSIALQTGAHAQSVEEYSASLEGRLRALAFAHDQSLAGAAGSGDLATLIEAEASLHRYGASPDRVIAEGPTIGLDDQTFGVLALVIHEMMTNAAKYGALSTPTGRLSVTWTLTPEGDCTLDWREAGGPTVAEPARKGFGSKLIQSTMAYDLGGAASVEFAPEGVRASFHVPRRHLRDRPAGSAPEHAETRSGAVLAGLNVLLVEDQALIAMDTEDVLRKLGAASVRSSPDVAQADAAITLAAPDCAVLDFNLGEATAEVIADRLTSLRVPFVFATGYGDSVMIPERFRGVPVVRKPVSAAVLADKLIAAKAAAPSASGA